MIQGVPEKKLSFDELIFGETPLYPKLPGGKSPASIPATQPKDHVPCNY